MSGEDRWVVGWDVEGVGMKVVRRTGTSSVEVGLVGLTGDVRTYTTGNTRLIILRRLRGSLCFYRARGASLFRLTRPVPNPSAKFCSRLTTTGQVILIASLFRGHTPKLCRGATIIFSQSKDVTKGCHGVRVPSSPTCCRGFCFAPKSVNFRPVRASLNGLNILIY